MELISIIIPVYNVEEYLNKCINSVLQQTYTNLQIILVDDGSTDSSSSICNYYQSIDNRIEVIHQTNQGLSMARNNGMKFAKGEYITFIDSDDIVSHIYIEKLYDVIKTHNVDISVCQHLKFYDYNEILEIDIKYKSEVEIILGSQACDLMYTHQYGNLILSTSKLFKRNIANTVEFPRGKINEDLFTSYLHFIKSSKIGIIKDQLYFYYIRPDSIVHSKFTIKNLDRYEACEIQLRYYQKNDMLIAYKNLLKHTHSLLLIDLKKDKEKKLQKELRKIYKNIMILINNSSLFNEEELNWLNAPYLYPSIFVELYWIILVQRNKFKKRG